MCILFVELCASPRPGGFRLILATNRDESLRRPTAKAHRWEEAPSVLGGRDLEPSRELGTWLAMDTGGAGRVAALLNVMGAGGSPEKLSRGFIAANLLRGTMPMQDYFTGLTRAGPDHNPFHLVGIDLDPTRGGIWHYSNVPEQEGQALGQAAEDAEVTHLTEGRFSLGNSPLSRPFRKVRAGEARFGECVERWGAQDTRDQLVDELQRLLKWDAPHLPDEELEKRCRQPEETIRRSSAVFQYHPEREYGTRTHTVILVDSNWRCDFHEWTMEEPVDPNSKWTHTYEVIQLDSAGVTNSASL